MSSSRAVSLALIEPFEPRPKRWLFQNKTNVIFALRINADNFIRCWKVLHFAVTQSIPCLRSILQQWQERNRKTIGPCQLPRPRPRPALSPRECSEKGRPTSSSSCSSCIAWGKAVEDVYYPQKSKGNIPWDTINPTCLARSHIMVAKAFLLRLRLGSSKCTKLEDLDLGSLLDIMMRFKDFLGGEKSTFYILVKVNLLMFYDFQYCTKQFYSYELSWQNSLFLTCFRLTSNENSIVHTFISS